VGNIDQISSRCPETRRRGSLSQEEIVRRTWIRRFDIPICRCVECGKRVQGRHPLQTSDAIGAAAVQVGPEALTLGVLMNKAQGLPHADRRAPRQVYCVGTIAAALPDGSA